MEKIGIVTLNGYENYGNRLQNYALQEVIKTMGYTVETVIIESSATRVPKSNFIKLLIKEPMKVIKKVNSKTNSFVDKQINKTVIKERKIRFKRFSSEKIIEKKLDIKNLRKIEEYSYFVVGSDQVWNPYYIKNSSENFLTFAPSSKRVSYAASFGSSSIPKEFIGNYKSGLREMKSISVREDIGATIIENLIKRSTEIVLDPTMLLTKEEWLKIAKAPDQKPSKKYILTYFLGELSKEVNDEIKKIASSKDLEIINLAKIKEKKWYTADPAEFIDLINSSELFCTDSFHGAVFSILLERPFLIFDRNDKTYSMNSRIETLLRKFSFENRLAVNIHTDNILTEMDFSHVDHILKKEREISLNYLKGALNREDFLTYK